MIRYAKFVVLIAAVGAGIGAVCGSGTNDVVPSGTTEIRVATPAPIQTPDSASGEFPPASTLMATIASFDEFPLLWVGESFDSDGDGMDDMPLSSASFFAGSGPINPRTGQPFTPQTRDFYISYGYCSPEPRSDSSCAPPVTLVFYPPDSPVLPFAGSLREGHSIAVRGATAWFNGGVVWLETTDFVVSIAVTYVDSAKEYVLRATRIANQLYGANAKAAGITKDTDFRAKPPASPTPVSFPTDPPDLNTPTPSAFPIIATETPAGTFPASTQIATASPQ